MGLIVQAQLKIQVASDPGDGTLEVFLGSASSWTETGLNGANKPTEVGAALASITGTHSLGQTKTWNLNIGQLPSGGLVTLIVKHSNCNDVAFASDETAQVPQLMLTSESAPAMPILLNIFSLSPNPASDEIALGFKVPTQVGASFIYDVSGKLVKTVPSSEVRSEGVYDMNVRGLPSGMYFVRTFDEKGIPHQKPMLIRR